MHKMMGRLIAGRAGPRMITRLFRAYRICGDTDAAAPPGEAWPRRPTRTTASGWRLPHRCGCCAPPSGAGGGTPCDVGSPRRRRCDGGENSLISMRLLINNFVNRVNVTTPTGCTGYFRYGRWAEIEPLEDCLHFGRRLWGSRFASRVMAPWLWIGLQQRYTRPWAPTPALP